VHMGCLEMVMRCLEEFIGCSEVAMGCSEVFMVRVSYAVLRGGISILGYFELDIGC